MIRLRKFLDSYFYIPVVFIVSFVFWYIAYSHRLDDNALVFMNKVENIALVTFGVVAALLLVLFKNTFYFIPWIIFVPFIFARPFDVLTIPVFIYVGLGIMVLGLVLNIIIYKPKLKIGKFFWGFLILCIAFVLGGINVPTENFVFQLFLTLLCVCAFLLLYCMIASSSQVDFKVIARLFTYLGIFLICQLAVYFFSQEDILAGFLSKNSNVGWGVSNNVALMLLFTFPFTFYLAMQAKNAKTIIYSILAFVQMFGIVVTYSRGSIFSLLIGLIVFLPFVIVKAKDKISLCGILIVILIVLVIGIFKFKTSMPEEFKQIHDILLKINLDNLNGRTPIYEECLKVLKENMIFGQGILSSYKDNGSGELVYEWGHSTILQTVRTMGLFGCFAMLVHLFQKYFVLLKKPNVWKITVVASFAISGFYGLFDVSYYFVNYMIPLVLGMAMLEYEFEKMNEVDYEVL